MSAMDVSEDFPYLPFPRPLPAWGTSRSENTQVEEKAAEPAAADAPVPMDAEEEELKEEVTYPNMELAQRVFTLDCPEPPENVAEIQQTILDDVRQDSMAPYYETLCSRFGWPVDDAFLGSMKSVHLCASRPPSHPLTGAHTGAQDRE